MKSINELLRLAFGTSESRRLDAELLADWTSGGLVVRYDPDFGVPCLADFDDEPTKVWHRAPSGVRAALPPVAPELIASLRRGL